MEQRLARLRAALADAGLPALLVSAPPNRRYLSGFTGSYGWLLVTPSAALIFTDGRYAIRSRQEAPDYRLSLLSNPGRTLSDALVEAVAELGLTALAFEAAHTSVAEHNQLSKALGGVVELLPCEGLVERLRQMKDLAELAVLRRAIAITDAAIEAVVPQLRPEHTERQAAWMLEVAMRERGADELSFPIIVAAGANAAMPHYHPGEVELGEGRPIVIDMGAGLEGYHADLTRTVVIGTPDERFWGLYDIVLEAERRGLAALRPGVTGSEVDAEARDYIAGAGYGENFSHGLGHGVGLNIHEGPSLRRGNAEPLAAGMVTSVEPGIYIEGWGGIRIEDLALVTLDGHEVLSQAAKLRQG
jgi:Xaa-Pro aminopeptidase